MTDHLLEHKVEQIDHVQLNETGDRQEEQNKNLRSF